MDIINKIAKKLKSKLCQDYNYKEYYDFFTDKEIESFKKFIDTELVKQKSCSIITHHNADPDAIGASISLARALSQKGIKSTIYAEKGVSKQTSIVLEKYPYPINTNIKEALKEKIIFLIDSSSPEQMANIKFSKEHIVILIDHHKKGKLYSESNLKYSTSKANSSAILVYHLLKASGFKITKEINFFITIGIITDTAFLRFADHRDFNVLRHTTKKLNLSQISSTLNVPEDNSTKIAKLKGVSRLKAYKIKNHIIAFTDIGSHESIVALTLIKNGADIGFAFNKSNNEVRISGRLKRNLENKINLAEIIKKIEPIIDGTAGGHASAASANGKNTRNIEQAKSTIIKEIEKKLNGKARKII